jgi:hypothetical protein
MNFFGDAESEAVGEVVAPGKSPIDLDGSRLAGCPLPVIVPVNG